MSEKLKEQVLSHVLMQVAADASGLSALIPSLQWQQRVEQTVKSFIPKLVELAPNLIEEVSLTLNSPQNIRRTWLSIKEFLQDRGWLSAIEQEALFLEAELTRESNLLTVVTGDTISSLISDFLCQTFPDLRKNNRSTYPDLYFGSLDYRTLPKRQRGLATGPALRGNYPTSVPDGIEIKSQKGKSIRVDCHHDHQGLHLVLTYKKTDDSWIADDVYVAYLSKNDYRRASRNTTATTEKFSFGHAPFISVIRGQVQEGELVTDSLQPEE